MTSYSSTISPSSTVLSTLSSTVSSTVSSVYLKSSILCFREPTLNGSSRFRILDDKQ